MPISHSLANPFQGTDSTHDFSHGNTLPLIAAPWGMHHWTLQTRGETRPAAWIFQYGDARCEGIRLTHSPSPWMGDYACLTIMPQSNETFLAEGAARSSSYLKSRTIAQPDYLSVTLDRYGIQMEVTPTCRAAFFRFHFQDRVTANAVGLHCFTKDCEIQASGNELSGWNAVPLHCPGVTPRLYFVARFDCDIQIANHETDHETSVCVRFSEPQRLVKMRIAASFISLEQARINLDREIGDGNFEEVRASTAAEWEDLFARISLATDDAGQAATFSSCLYRSLLFPRIFHEEDDHGRQVHYSPMHGDVRGGAFVTDNGFWDTHRTVYPFLSLVYPDRLAEILNGWLQFCGEAGWTPKWSSPGLRSCMIGTHLDVVFADAAVKQIPDFDPRKAVPFILRDAFEAGDEDGFFGRRGLALFEQLGYVPFDKVPYSVSRTLDFSYNDFCCAKLLSLVGEDEKAAELSRRAECFRNLFDPAIGFMRARHSDGRFEEPFREFEWGNAYIEGGPWQHSFNVPHAIPELIALHGGPGKFVTMLDRMMSTPPRFGIGHYPAEIHEMSEMAAVPFGQYAHSNQPVHNYLSLFAHAGRSDLTTHWMHRVLRELYNPGPKGFCGDEDNGEMSSWYLLATMGLWPYCPGKPDYQALKPNVQQTTIRLPNGRETILRHSRNPEPESLLVSHARVTAGGEILL